MRTEPLFEASSPIDSTSTGVGASSSSSSSWKHSIVARVRLRRLRQTSSSAAAPIPLDFIRTTLDAQRHIRAAYGQVILFVPLLLAFLFLFYAERDIEGDYYSSSAVKLLFTEAALPPVDLSSVPPNNTVVAAADRNPYSRWGFFDNAQERGDGYVALKQLLLPILFPPESERADIFNITTGSNDNNGGVPLYPAPDNLRVVLGGAVQAVGPVRLRSKHVRGHSCNADETLFGNSLGAIRFFNDHCYAQWSGGDEATSWFSLGAVPWVFSRDGCTTGPLTGLFGLVHHYSCGGFVVDLPIGTTSLDAARSVADAMSTERFQNGLHARLFQVEWFGYRGSGNVFLDVNLYTEITTGGGWNVRAEVTPFRLAHMSAGWIVYATLIACCFIGMTALFVKQAVVHASTRGSILSSFLLLPWNLVELANLVAFYVWFAFYCMWWSLSRRYQSELRTPEARDAVTAFPLHLLELRQIYWTTVYLNALNVLFLFLKFLKFLRLNARINVLQRTIVASARSILSVVALLCLFVLAYAIAGMLLYGPLLFEYRTFPEAWASTFRALIGGFDYGAMQAAYRGATFLYFWTLMVFGVFVLLNFCIAILMQHFDEQSNRSQLPPVSVSVGLAWERLVYYLHEHDASHIMRDVLSFAVGGSRDHHLSASILVERAAKRKLLQAKRHTATSTTNPTATLEEDAGGASFGDSRNSSAHPSVEEAALSAARTLEQPPSLMLETPHPRTNNINFQRSRSNSAASKAFLLDDPSHVPQSARGRSAVDQGAQVVDVGVDKAPVPAVAEFEEGHELMDDDISFSMTASARKHRPSVVELQSPPSQPRRASWIDGSLAQPLKLDQNSADGPTAEQDGRAPQTAEGDPLKPTPRGGGRFGRRRSSTIERIHRAWRRSTLRKAEREEDMEVVELDIKALSSANDCILISFADLENEMKSVNRRITQVDALLHALTLAEEARGGSAPHCAPEDEALRLFPAPGSTEATMAYRIALQREQRLLQAIHGIPDADLRAIWCQLYDDFEGTDTAHQIKQQQDRTRVIQASVARAVSSALIPLRRRLFFFSNPTSVTSSLSRASLKTGGSYSGGGGGRMGAMPALQLSGSAEEYASYIGDSPSSVSVSTTLVCEPSNTDILSDSSRPLSAVHPAAARRRPRAGSILASTLFPSMEVDTEGTALAAPRLTNGEAACSIAQSLTDMETHLGAMNALLEGTVAQLVSVTCGGAASPCMV